MTLADLTLPISYEDAKGYALVFDATLAQRLGQLHDQVGRPDCIAMPSRLTDGRFMLCADILTAIVPGGWLHEMWEKADKAMLLPAVEVIPWADAVALLPAPKEP